MTSYLRGFVRGAGIALLMWFVAVMCGCSTKAFTLPLPGGASVAVPLAADAGPCTFAHEAVHQAQVARMGAAVFVANIAAEYLAVGKVCGELEWPAYMAGWRCIDPTYISETPESVLRELACEGTK